jgi:hypothetical protein
MFRMLLGIASLTLLWFFCGAGSAQPKDAAAPKAGLEEVSGFGSNEETAKQNAIKKAVEAINRLMAAQDPPIKSFVVTEDDLTKNKLLQEPGRAGKEVKAIIENKEIVSKEWIVTFRSDWWQEIVRRDHHIKRQEVATNRQHFGSQVILGLGLLLLAGVGYVRLDDYTQRRYTTWLRLAGVAAATTLAAGWWMFVQAPG